MNTDLLLMNWNVNSNEPVKTRGFRHAFVVREFECGLLYRHGKFQSRLEALAFGTFAGDRGYALLAMTLISRKQTFAVARPGSFER